MIGSTVWVQDGGYNRVGLDRWSRHVIVGETKVSWIVGEDHTARRFSKKIKPGDSCRWIPTWNGRERVAMTEKERDDIIFCELHSRSISDQVGACRNANLLRAIADIVGYVDRK